MQFKVLAVDVNGLPREWITLEDSIVYYAKGMVEWSLGETIKTFKGGTQKNGRVSELSTPSIIAIKGKRPNFNIPSCNGTNKLLFKRDNYTCAYCGYTFDPKHLSRDHIIPTSRGGKDQWINIITACKCCNIEKNNRTPTEWGYDLLFAPYVPNYYELLLMENYYTILDEQLEYLLHGVPKHSRIAKHLSSLLTHKV